MTINDLSCSDGISPLIVWTESGISKFAIWRTLRSQSVFKFDGDSNVIDLSGSQPIKHSLRICWIEAGIEICGCDLHELKALSSIISSTDRCSKVTETRFSHSSKQMSPINWTEDGMQIDFSAKQPRNAQLNKFGNWRPLEPYSSKLASVSKGTWTEFLNQGWNDWWSAVRRQANDGMHDGVAEADQRVMKNCHPILILLFSFVHQLNSLLDYVRNAPLVFDWDVWLILPFFYEHTRIVDFSRHLPIGSGNIVGFTSVVSLFLYKYRWAMAY
jgi:hypothetical protein